VRRTSFILALAAACWGGCSNAPKPARPGGGGPIREVNVITSPVGLNLDGVPGVDGFSMKVYANNASNPKTVALRGGSLALEMYDGTFYGRTNAPQPARTWRYGAEDLPSHQVGSSIGVGYEFVLMWGTNRPTQRIITVLARYSDGQGREIVSPPSSVTVLDR
jgi:hypothetical protein